MRRTRERIGSEAGQGLARSSPTGATLMQSGIGALASATTRVALVGGKLSWEAIAADSIYGMQSAFMQQHGGQMASGGNDELAAISRDSGQSIDWSRGIKLADSGGTMTDGLSPTEEAIRSSTSRDQVRILSGGADSDAEVDAIVRAKEAAYRAEAGPHTASSTAFRNADGEWELVPITVTSSPPPLVEDSLDSFMRGYRGEYRSVVKGEAPLAETVGRYTGAAVDSFRAFGDTMTGAGNMRNAMASWRREDYGLSLIQGGLAFAEAGMTLAGFGTTGTARSAGTATLKNVQNTTTAAGTLGRIESRFGTASREVGFIVDAESGNLLAVTRQPYGQTSSSFRFSPEQWSMAEGNWITHNHPSGLTLGIEDMAGAVSSGARGIRASTAAGTYKLSFDSSFASAYRGDYGGAFGFLQAETNSVGRGIMADIKSGALTVPEGLQGTQYKGFLANEMWVRYANQAQGLQYSFIPRKLP